ncbi:hypothetical protein J2X63_002127 [Agromyces sp. 3263]|uniref:hypothetical protein n=1 Tax=Agromyces sp. 3263 TaxID=2817750 RepID=UPI002856E3C1|nr:hypothetical protein [Agromyces sp. 3263]MDR6906441.1 hypothetical protein [Agromyces sp. 3263]
MELAYAYVAQTLQTHDELVAARVNQQRRIAAERRADDGERAEQRHGQGLGHRFAEWRRGRQHDRIQGLPIAH